MSTAVQTKESVQEYYGRTLTSNEDLKTSACCSIDAMPAHLQPLLKNIHDEVHAKFYGCSSPIPLALEGRTVLDLGCGTGRDSYLLSQLVGPKGMVIGVDMTDEQLAVATKHIGYHMQQFQYDKANVTFRQGFIEDLKSIEIEDSSIDVVVSNCVINLSPEKEQVFSEIFRVLKPGGELYFSDVFTGRRVPNELRHNKVLLGECLGGAMYIEDFRRILRDVGCLDYRVVSRRNITLDNREIYAKVGMVDFYSMTVRAFKCEFEDICEDYGHVAYYKGTIPESPPEFMLDDPHLFKTGMPVPVCGNTANMLGATRYGDHFRIEGNFSTHYGPFDCSPALAPQTETATGGCC